MKRYRDFCVKVSLFAVGLLCSSVYADDLMQVYQQALKCDPVFAQAQSTWKSQKMNLPIAEAGYLPQVSVTGSTTRQFTEEKPPVSTDTSGENWEYTYGLTLTQPIFNGPAWSAIKGASAKVKSATATYLAAQQSLMQRSASLYFKVLQAYDQLRYTDANKRAVWQQFEAAQQQFKVGLIAITDEYDARARYDKVYAQEIAAKNNLNVQIENLRALTGHDYTVLKGLGTKLPLLKPQPDNIDEWVQVANRQNYAIKAQNYTVIAAMEFIKQQAGAGYPSLNLTGGISETHTVSGNSALANQTGDTSEHLENIGLSMSYTPLQGGLIVSSTKQARCNYVTAAGKLEQTHRDVLNQTRSSFLSVISGISQVQADKQTIISSQNALEATEAGFHVGTRTMVDVLNSLSALYQSQQAYATDQYTYIASLIDLKAAAGTLSVADLEQINSWLGKNVAFPKQTDLVLTLKENEKADKKFHSTSYKNKKVTTQKNENVEKDEQAAAINNNHVTTEEMKKKKNNSLDEVIQQYAPSHPAFISPIQLPRPEQTQ